MALRTENGWYQVGSGQCLWTKIPGAEHVTLQIQQGWPLSILRAFAADFHAYVEPLRDADSACWTPTNSVATSNHLSGTAMDLNWQSHPFQVADAGFDAGKIATIRELLAFYEDTVFWANDWDYPKDAMHFQLGYTTWDNPHTGDFINRKIRPDGFSTFRRGEAPPVPEAARALADATGLGLARATEILPAVRAGLLQSDATNVNRIAMWLAQVGHESVSFVYTAEIASGDAYDTRTDLGNTPQVDGDGRLYKGRTWIQITGKHNYREFSQWAYGRGICPTPTYFVDNPLALSNLEYAGVGAAWYWTVARSDINALSDRRDLDTVTRRINGGTNGIADRRTRYDRALGVGDRLLTILEGDDELADPAIIKKINEIHGALFNYIPSQSIYATPGEGDRWQLHELVKNMDATSHHTDVEAQALIGDLDAVERIVRTAKGQGVYTYPAAIERAKRALAQVEEFAPEVLQAYISKKGSL